MTQPTTNTFNIDVFKEPTSGHLFGSSKSAGLETFPFHAADGDLQLLMDRTKRLIEAYAKIDDTKLVVTKIETIDTDKPTPLPKGLEGAKSLSKTIRVEVQKIAA